MRGGIGQNLGAPMEHQLKRGRGMQTQGQTIALNLPRIIGRVPLDAFLKLRTTGADQGAKGQGLVPARMCQGGEIGAEIFRGGR